jgi:hypothetical protein
VKAQFGRTALRGPRLRPHQQPRLCVLHLGGKYVDSKAVAERFFERISPETGVLRYLTLENDERSWPVVDIGQSACLLPVPVVTDAFHRGLSRYTRSFSSGSLRQGSRKGGTRQNTATHETDFGETNLPPRGSDPG